ncbi:nuclear mitotic apparatus protein 1 isoform X2 [Phyllopteryx taeniolatus]|nr:nuclear mitotic apparatus protein 1 isoform X2 [Phyllopteryx taeniolatus]
MSLNMGVKALLKWVNSITLGYREIDVEDLQDGELLLRVVYKMKKEPNPPFIKSTEERFKLIAEFVEKDCRFSPTIGTLLSWDNIRNGINLTVEIAKVLLLLVYYDMMNERCTLKALECEVEREIANLTGSFVIESVGGVYLNNGLDAYLSKRYLPVPLEILERTVSTSNASTVSSLSDGDSPVFPRTPKITFLDMHTVASSSVSKSPLQDIMNTPKFQLRKLQRQMVKERDHMDRLEKELASKISLIAQRESHINQLQYCLDKMKGEQSDQEQTTREQINELQSKNNSLQLRLSEILKENKDCKSNFSLMERKVDELEEENGVLSSQIRAAHAQLSIFQAEVGRLTENHLSGQEESRTKMDYLHSELNQATAQKELLTEQIQILQGRISCLEDDIRAATKEDVGENLGPIIERDALELEIGCLKNELDSTFGCLKKAEANVEAKTLQLSAYEEEITQQKELLEQQNLHIEDIVQTKDRISKELQKEISEQRAALQKEIDYLKLQLEQAKQQNAAQISELQKHIAALQQELDNLKEMSREKEYHLNQAKENVKDLETKFHDLTSILVDKNNQINILKEEVEVFTMETMKNKNEIEIKDQLLAQLRLQDSNQQDILQNRIQTLTLEVENLSSSVQRAEQEVQLKHDLLAKTQQENIEQRAVLQQQIITSEMEACRLSTEMEARNEQLVILQKDSSKQSEILQEQINLLKSQVECLNTSLTNAEEHVQSLQALLAKQEQESVCQKDLLQQQLTVSEESVRTMKEEIQTKEEHITLLNKQSSENSKQFHKDIQSLEGQVESLTLSLKNAEENLQSKESLFANQHSQSTRHIETLQTQIVSSQEEVSRLISKLHSKEEQLESMKDSIHIAKNQVKAKEDFIVNLEKENTFHMDMLKKHNMDLVEEAAQFKEEIRTKEDQLDLFKVESGKLSEVLKNEIESLKSQIQSVTVSLQSTEEQVQTKVNQLANNEMEISKEREKYQSLMESSSEEVTMLRERIQAQEEQLATLREEGSSQSDMLYKEISQLKNQLAVVNNLLSEAEQRVQAQLAMMTTQEQESAHQKELLQHQLSVTEAEVRKMNEEIEVRDERVMQLNATNSEESDLLCQEIQHLKKQVESLDSSRRKAEEDVQFKNDLLVQQQKEADRNLQENNQKEELLQKRISSFEEEILKLRECQDEKQKLLIRAEEKLEMLQTELVAVKTQAADKDNSLQVLRAEVSSHNDLAQKANEEAQVSAKMLVEQQDENAKQTNALKMDIQVLQGQLEVISLQLMDKEQQMLKTQQESAQLIEKLQLQVVSLNADLQQHENTQIESFKHWEGQQDHQKAITIENETLVQEKEVLLAKILQAEKDQKALENQVNVLVLEKMRLVQTKQATERENLASLRLEQVLKQELELSKLEKDRLLKEMETNEESERHKKELQEQLAVKTEAVEHYKAQMEKAVSHYNDKKQLLHESQEEVAEFKHCLEVREREAKATGMELKLLQLELEKAQSKEKNMLSKLTRLETQVAFADLNLRAHNRITGHEADVSESCYLEVPASHSNVHNKAKPKRTMSSDSLDQSSLEDSLNNTRKLPATKDSSTPLVRSSERLAAKRSGLRTESLETLYFTPINTRHINRTSTENKIEVDSAFINPSSSIKRRRTTQVINITMTKKTPGANEGDETFYSLAPARSHPNLSSAHSARPVSMELFETPTKMTGAANDQLSCLPGYRRSTLHSQTPNTFCVGAENEPDGAPDDWMRIAELQARNKACLPHLKSSYPVEFEAGCKSTFIFTDEEVRTGDPTETIRRASVMPGQLQDSVASHRHSLAAGQLSTAGGTRSQRLSLMAGHAPSKSVSSSHVRSPKCTKRSGSTLSVPQTSPEKKLKASCFPRPLTPKNKNINSGPVSSQLHPSLSPADRRQSMMFTIDNTPKNNTSSYLKKGLNKLRSSTRKSPGKTSKRSPANAVRKENKSAETSRVAVGRAGRVGGFKSPRVVSKENRKSPQTAGKAAKSPRLTASARKCVSISEANPLGRMTR